MTVPFLGGVLDIPVCGGCLTHQACWRLTDESITLEILQGDNDTTFLFLTPNLARRWFRVWDDCPVLIGWYVFGKLQKGNDLHDGDGDEDDYDNIIIIIIIIIRHE
jgi:hypothetical protein